MRLVPQRIVRAANRNPFLTSIIMALLIFIGGFLAYEHQNDNNVKRAKAQAVQESEARAKDIAKAVAKSNLDVCQRAVTSVTSQLNADLIQVIKTIEQRLIEQNRPISPVYIQLEDLIRNRKPPLEACIPKENP